MYFIIFKNFYFFHFSIYFCVIFYIIAGYNNCLSVLHVIRQDFPMKFVYVDGRRQTFLNPHVFCKDENHIVMQHLLLFTIQHHLGIFSVLLEDSFSYYQSTFLLTTLLTNLKFKIEFFCFVLFFFLLPPSALL